MGAQHQNGIQVSVNVTNWINSNKKTGLSESSCEHGIELLGFETPSLNYSHSNYLQFALITLLY